jgi:hypothetical protein
MPPAEAFLEYRAMAADFKKLADVTDFKKQAGKLARRPEIGEPVQVLEKHRAALLDDFFRLARDSRDPALPVMIAGWREKAGAPGETAERQQIRRVLQGACVRCAGIAWSSLAKGESFEQALGWAELASALCPEQPSLAYNLACLQALAGHNPEALIAFRRAAQNGFNDVARAWHDPAFRSLRGEAEFQSALLTMKNQAPAPDPPVAR